MVKLRLIAVDGNPYNALQGGTNPGTVVSDGVAALPWS